MSVKTSEMRRGDIFLKSQEGGIAGGHNNINNVLNKQENIKSTLRSIAGKLKGSEMKSNADYWKTLAELEEMKEQLDAFQTEVKSLKKIFKKKKNELLKKSGRNEELVNESDSE